MRKIYYREFPAGVLKREAKGFTVLELILAVFIVMILTAVTFIYFSQRQMAARDGIRSAEFSGES